MLLELAPFSKRNRFQLDFPPLLRFDLAQSVREQQLRSVPSARFDGEKKSINSDCREEVPQHVRISDARIDRVTWN